MRWLAHRGGAQHHRRWKAAGKPEPLPACAVIGADPGTILAAVTPVPDTLSEYQFAGLLRGAKVDLVRAKTVPLLVPAEAEIVIEGHVLLDEYADEGPYGDHTGYYNSVEQFPVFQVSAITMRRDPIYLTTYTGRPPDEPSVLGEALNEVFIPLFQQQFPEIVDFWLPPEGCSYRIAVVSIKKAYPGHAKRVMLGVWSYLRQFMYTKWVIVVDDDIDARDWKDVMWALSTRMDPARDITSSRTRRSTISTSPRRSRPGLEDRPRRHRQMAAGDQARMGPPRSPWTRRSCETVTEKWARLGLPGDGKPPDDDFRPPRLRSPHRPSAICPAWTKTCWTTWSRPRGRRRGRGRGGVRRAPVAVGHRAPGRAGRGGARGEPRPRPAGLRRPQAGDGLRLRRLGRRARQADRAGGGHGQAGAGGPLRRSRAGRAAGARAAARPRSLRSPPSPTAEALEARALRGRGRRRAPIPGVTNSNCGSAELVGSRLAAGHQRRLLRRMHRASGFCSRPGPSPARARRWSAAARAADALARRPADARRRSAPRPAAAPSAGSARARSPRPPRR